ncbi:VOC family protein [Halomonas huangheensis]|uniref:PhnB-like domain-containing protein n=1 Tax=Halomonas huangheensis TaxID=1178482 RepID=W1N2F6_9GAMM|nr:VOC family protein [Halomonas huangheensis]ALM51257.1 hypothetical protein AR456_02325 [Halomonas huangheensis]ERL49683.1 hypothetical protein BJB45_00765 [Halomonas huangheensis]
MTRVSTHLMFQGNASEALTVYRRIFSDFVVQSMECWPEEEASKPGLVKQARISFCGHDLMVIDSPVPHDFDFSPSTSLLVDFETPEALQEAFTDLAEGGQIMMPLDDYGFSRRFGWVVDCFGVSWQLNLPA